MLNKTCVDFFCYENKIAYPVYLPNQKFDNSMDLLLISNNFVSHYVYIKDFNRLMFNKTKNKNKKYFCKSSLQCFNSESILDKYKMDCLLVNGGKNVKLEKGFLGFKNYSRQILLPFKIYADIKCILKDVDVSISNDNISYTKKNIKIIFLVVLLINWCVLIINIVKKLFCIEEKMQLIKLLGQF